MAAAGVKLSPASLMLETVSGGAYTGYSDTQNAIKEGAAVIYNNPGAVVDAAIKPFSDAVARGDYGEAVGRGAFELASMVFAPAPRQKEKALILKVLLRILNDLSPPVVPDRMPIVLNVGRSIKHAMESGRKNAGISSMM